MDLLIHIYLRRFIVEMYVLIVYMATLKCRSNKSLFMVLEANKLKNKVLSHIFIYNKN